jgi:hypothetical protein
MRYVFAVVASVFAFSVAPASAYWTSNIASGKIYRSGTFRHYDDGIRIKVTAREMSGGHISGECWIAARKGGPCGCEASKLVYGHSVRDLWLVSNWRKFPRTTGHVGAAALWGNHHVEIVVADKGDRVDTAGSVGFTNVPKNRLTFVQP